MNGAQGQKNKENLFEMYVSTDANRRGSVEDQLNRNCNDFMHQSWFTVVGEYAV